MKIDEFIETIEDYLNLQPGWDGYNGIAPTKETVELSKEILLFIHKETGVFPKPGVSGDGLISLFIEKPGLFFDIGVDEEGKYSFYAQTVGKNYYGDDGIVKEIDQDQNLKQALKHLS